MFAYIIVIGFAFHGEKRPVVFQNYEIDLSFAFIHNHRVHFTPVENFSVIQNREKLLLESQANRLKLMTLYPV